MKRNSIKTKSKRSYYQNLKMLIARHIATWHNYRRFWLYITFASILIITFSCLLFDNFLGVAASEEFAPIRISLFTIFSANIICAINPKKLYFRVVGYGCGFVGSIIGLKSSCFLWAVYQTANMQDYTVAKKSLFEIGRCLFNIGTKCGIENNTIMGNVGGSHLYNLIERTHDNALVIISQSTFVYALSVYMLIFACMLIVLYTAFVCSAIRRG